MLIIPFKSVFTVHMCAGNSDVLMYVQNICLQYNKLHL